MTPPPLATGWMYTYCFLSADVNECASEPCMNRGICRDHPGGYTCGCFSSHTGAHCEMELPLPVASTVS